MDDRYNVECRRRRFYPQPFNYGDADRAERRTVAEAKADVESAVADNRSERRQHYLRRFWNSVVASQIANARTVMEATGGRA